MSLAVPPLGGPAYLVLDIFDLGRHCAHIMMRPLGIVLSLALLACGDSESDPGPETSDWKPVEGPPEAFAYGAVWSSGPEDVWVTADSARVLHFDGSVWTETTLETTDMMMGIWAFGPNDLWMVGGRSLARYDGSTWTVTDLGQEAPGVEGLTSIWGSSPSDVWVVGSQSTAAHWDGSTWTIQLAAGPENTAVWGSGPNDVYTVSVFDVAHWDGSTWTNLEDDLLWGADGVFGFGPDDVWLASGSEELLHWDGVEWTELELDVFGGPSTLWGTAPDDLWGVGDFGSIVHYDGQQWRGVAHQALGSPYLRTFHGVHGSSTTDVWAVGSQAGEGGVVPLLWRYLPD